MTVVNIYSISPVYVNERRCWIFSTRTAPSAIWGNTWLVRHRNTRNNRCLHIHIDDLCLWYVTKRKTNRIWAVLLVCGLHPLLVYSCEKGSILYYMKLQNTISVHVPQMIWPAPEVIQLAVNFIFILLSLLCLFGLLSTECEYYAVYSQQCSDNSISIFCSNSKIQQPKMLYFILMLWRIIQQNHNHHGPRGL